MHPRKGILDEPNTAFVFLPGAVKGPYDANGYIVSVSRNDHLALFSFTYCGFIPLL